MAREAAVRWLTRWPLRVSLPLLVSIALLAGGLVGYARQVMLVRTAAVTADTRALLAMSGVYAAEFRNLYVRQERVHLREHVASLAANPAVTRAVLADDRGQVLGSTRRAESGTDATAIPELAAPPAEATVTARGDHLVLRAPVPLTPVYVHPPRIGTLLIAHDLKPTIAAETARLHQLAWDYAVFFGTVIVLLGLWFERVVARRLRELMPLLARIREGERGVRLPVSGSDELATVVHAANAALDAEDAKHAAGMRLTHALEQLAYLDPARDSFDAICEAVRTGLGCDGVGVGRLLPDELEMRMIGVAGNTEGVRSGHYAVRGTPCEFALARAGEVVVIPREVMAQYPAAAGIAALGAEAYRGVALRDAQGGILGVLFALDCRPCEHSEADTALLRTAGNRAAQEMRRECDAARLREREASLELALDVGDIGRSDWFLAEDRFEVSDAWARMLGYRPEEIGRTSAGWRALVHPDDLPRMTPVLDAHIRHGAVIQPVECRLLGADGTWRWIRASVRVMARDAEGRALHLLGMHVDIHALKMAQEVAHDHARYLHLAIEAGRLGPWEWRRDSGRTRYSAEWAQALGYSDSQVPTTLAEELALIHPEDHAAFERGFDACVEGRVAQYECEFRLRDAAGRWRWILERGAGVDAAADGCPARIYGVQQDVTSLKETEARLRERTEFLEAAVRGSMDGLWDWDLRTDRAYFSPRFHELLGYVDGDLPTQYGQFLHLAHHPEEREHHVAALERLARDASYASRDLRLRTRAGEWRWYHARFAIIRDTEGGATRLVGSISDVTDRKQREDELAQARAFLAETLDSVDAAIVRVDKLRRVLFLNRAYREGAGLAEDRAMVGVPYSALVREIHLRFRKPGSIPPIETLVQERVARLDDAAPYEVKLGERWFLIQNRPTLDGGVIGIRTDITALKHGERERRELQRNVQQAQKMEALGQLTGGIAHDFNNILASVLGYAALAELDVRDRPKLAEYLAAIREAGERARGLVAKMLEFSRQTPSETVGSSDAALVLREALRFLKPIVPAGIRLVQEIDAACETVAIDSVDLHQVLVNLAINARDACGGHGRIAFSLMRARRHDGNCRGCKAPVDGEYVELTIADSGSGILPEHLDRLFEPFFSTKEIGKGTGMGLAVTHSVVHRAGGHLLVDSVPGAGTHMRVLLRSAAALPTLPAMPPQLPAPGGQQRILVVDDEPLITNLLIDLLKSRGYRPHAFTDSLAAIDYVRAHPDAFDAAISDLAMPGASGIDLVRAVRAVNSALPILVCTGYNDRMDGALVAELGIHAVLAKPVDFGALLLALGEALRRADEVSAA